MLRASLLAVALAGAWPVHGQSLAGRVVDAFSGQPVEGATVVLVGTLYASVVDTAGAFRLDRVLAGTYDLEASHHGYAVSRQRVMVAEGQSISLEIALVPEFADLPPPPAVGHSQHYVGIQRPLHETLRTIPAVQIGRRTLHDYALAIRGLRGAQVGVSIDGTRGIPDSPLGLPLHTLLLPYDLEIVTGPYALVWGAYAFGNMRVQTPFQDAIALESGYSTSPGSYDITAVMGRVRSEFAYDVTGRYGMANSYLDPVLTDMSVQAARGRVRFRRRLVEVTGWAGYEGRGEAITQSSVGTRWAPHLRQRVMHSLEIGGTWQRRAFSGWPYADSGDQREQHANAYARLHMVPREDWTMVMGLDFVGMRQGDDRMEQASLYMYGVKETGRVAYSGAIRGEGLFRPWRAYINAAAGTSVELSTDWRLGTTMGTMVRPAGIYERLSKQAPYMHMPFVFKMPGNAALGSERMLQMDLSLRRGTMASISVFWQRILRRIHVDFYAMDLPAYMQEDAVHWGGEAVFRRALMRNLAQVTVQVSYVRGTDVAPLSAYTGVLLRAPADLFRIEVDLKGMGPTRFALFQRHYRLSGQIVMDMRLHFRLPRQLSVASGITNVTGARFGWPASGLGTMEEVLLEPGRQWFIRLRRGL